MKKPKSFLKEMKMAEVKFLHYVVVFLLFLSLIFLLVPFVNLNLGQSISQSTMKGALKTVSRVAYDLKQGNRSKNDASYNSDVPILSGAAEENGVVMGDMHAYGISAGGGLPRLSSEDLEKYFEHLSDLGIEWVRFDFDWSKIEGKGEGIYDWSGTDRVVLAAKKSGISLLGIISYAPRWAAVPTCESWQHCAPKNPYDYAHFSGQAASRYKDSILAWEIWNEPNMAHFWGPRSDAGRYAEMIKQSYQEIKLVNKEAIVISGGLAVTSDKNGNISPEKYISSLYEMGSFNYFDAISLHPYTYPKLPRYDDYENNWYLVKYIQSLQEKHGGISKRIWITEYGVPTGGPGIQKPLETKNYRFNYDYVSEVAQRDMLVAASRLYEENTQWFGPFFWYTLIDYDAKSRASTENNYGLLHYNWSEKLSYKALKELIKNNASL